MAFKALPTFYYHTHFIEFLDFIKGACSHLLNDEHRTFLTQFDSLEQAAQCTVVRIINRKYPIIKTSSLVFPEIPTIKNILPSLYSIGFIGSIQATHQHAFVGLITKPELIKLFKQCAPPDIPALNKSANKTLWQSHCLALNPEKIASSELAATYIVCQIDAYIKYFLYLYFGHSQGTLNQFSMRDLGLMQTRDEQAQMQSRFSDYDTAFSCFTLNKLRHQIKQQSFTCAKEIEDIITDLPVAHGQQALDYHKRLMLRLAKAMLNFDAQRAVNIAEVINSPMAQEFWCRQAYKLGHKLSVKTRLKQLIDNPPSEHALQFSEDFLARKFKQKRSSVLSDMLRDSNRHISIDETHKGNVEHGVIAYYKARGIGAWRTENRLWSNLFGLCFWHELFHLEGLGLATAFDYLPTCIKHHTLMDVAGKEIHQRLASIHSNHDLRLLLGKHASAHFGKSQGIVNWHKDILEHLNILVQHSSLQALKSQLLHMCEDYQLNNDGYPDIMVLENSQLRFEEIKAQGDSLRRNQLLQIQHLQQCSFDVDITKVDFTYDPMQAYAVVDIETTGGKANTHKITEIGIVKVVNGEVVDHWQTLVNPQRHIPAMITRLTGINNDMVANAPLFMDIADNLEAFTDNCIFVAHNVNFDYGFIREEYARINRIYRRPKLCTVQKMRQHYPGLKSYSLANLTAYFNIDMQQHHRALSDAKAAAALLELINQKRTK